MEFEPIPLSKIGIYIHSGTFFSSQLFDLFNIIIAINEETNEEIIQQVIETMVEFQFMLITILRESIYAFYNSNTKKHVFYFFTEQFPSSMKNDFKKTNTIIVGNHFPNKNLLNFVNIDNGIHIVCMRRNIPNSTEIEKGNILQELHKRSIAYDITFLE
jgi:hypothetical protein